jgi:phosphonate degradation associated HDIG domain protein
MKISDRIILIFAERGSEEYHGEAVSQYEHAVQSAALAVADDAPESLIVAALLHDIGHLTHNEGEDAAHRGIDTRHEDDAEAWLGDFFGPEITEPIKLHVAAKRYLTAVEPEYLAGLSPASQKSLELQGGPFNDEERAEFEQHPFYAEAVRLRRWDDQAKVPGLDVPRVEHYGEMIDRMSNGK